MINRHKHQISAGLHSAGWGLARAAFHVELKKETSPLLLASPEEPGAEDQSAGAEEDVNCKREKSFSWIEVRSRCRTVRQAPDTSVG